MPVCIDRVRASPGPNPPTKASTSSVQLKAALTARRVAPAGDRDAEERDHLVAHELVDAPAVALDYRCRVAPYPAHDRFDLFGVEGFAERGVAGEVREHDRRVRRSPSSAAASAGTGAALPHWEQKR